MPTYAAFRNAVRTALSRESRFCRTLTSSVKETYLETLTEIELLHRIKNVIRWSSTVDRRFSLLSTGRTKHNDLECWARNFELDIEAKWFCTNTTRAHLKRAGIEGWCWLTQDWHFFVGKNRKQKNNHRRSVYLAMFPTADPGSTGVQRTGTHTRTGSWAFSQCISGALSKSGLPPNANLFKPYWPIARQDKVYTNKLVFRHDYVPLSVIPHMGQKYYAEVVGDPHHDATWALLITDRPYTTAGTRRLISSPPKADA